MKITIKDSWKEVTIKEFFEIKECLEKYGSDDDIELNLTLISILSGVDKNILSKMPVSSLYDITKELKFISEPIKGDVQKKYNIAGKEYNCSYDASGLIVAQYQDVCNLVNSGRTDQIHELLAIIMTIHDEEYNSDNYARNREYIYENFNIADAHSISLFFSLLLKSYTTAILTYSNNQIKNIIRKEQNDTKRKNMSQIFKNLKDIIKPGTSRL